MRISLADRQAKRHHRRSNRSKRNRWSQYRLLDSSLDQVQFASSARPGPASPPVKRRRPETYHQGLQEETAALPRRQIQWRTVFLRLTAVLVLLLSLGALVYVSTARDFFVYDRNTAIEGNQYIDRASILQAAGVDELNIFWIKPRKVAERIRKLDGIKTVSVHCALPAKVVVRVEERKPVVRWHVREQKKDWWLDDEGVVLPYTGIMSTTVSVIDLSRQQLKIGDRVTPDGIVPSVRRLAQSLPTVQVIYYQADRGLSFAQKTAGGEWPVYVGDSEDLPRKIQVLQALTQYLESNKIRPRYVDVRWADYPVYGKPDGQATGGGD